jgi:hypothetical protein
VGDERDRHKLASDEPDVEAHRFKVNPDETDEAGDDVEAHRFKANPDEPTDEADDDDTPDVEAHRHKL